MMSTPSTRTSWSTSTISKTSSADTSDSRTIDFGFRPLPLGNVAVDQDEATARYCTAADFDHPAIWSCPFEAQFLVGVFEAAAEFRLDVVECRTRRDQLECEDSQRSLDAP
jgi:hypothetical protein